MDARIEDGIVVELFPEGAPEFHPLIEIVPCGDNVELGWLWDGVVFTAPASVERTEDEIRLVRNTFLEQTDWLAVQAYETQTPMPQEWLDYRQQLRDITLQVGFPANVVWPIRPDLIDIAD